MIAVAILCCMLNPAEKPNWSLRWLQAISLSVLMAAFPGESELVGLLELRMMEVVVTTGAMRRTKFQSKHHHQQTNMHSFYKPDALPVAKPTASKHWRERLQAITLSLSLSVLTAISRWTWVSRCLLKQRMMEVVVTTGVINCAKLQSNHHQQQTNTQFFYRPDTLPVAQPTAWKHWRENITFHGLAYPKLTWGSSNFVSDH